MNAEISLDLRSPPGVHNALPASSIEKLTLDIYDSASPAVKSELLTQLVSKVYDAAAPQGRRLILETLLQHLGVLSLVTVANGIFARYHLRGEGQDWQVRVEDATAIRTRDVIALVDHVQQISATAIHRLAEVIAASPVLANSATASVLMMVQLRNSPRRRSTDNA